jgi:hypothetical protein
LENLPNDIEPIVEIINYSFYYFSISIGLFIFLLYFTMKFFFKRTNFGESDKKIFLNMLKSVNIENSRESAYKITELGRKLADSERSKRVLDELIIILNNYKYRREIEPFADEVLAKFQIFLEVLESE